jgi:hypothetical protein
MVDGGGLRVRVAGVRKGVCIGEGVLCIYIILGIIY